MKRTFFFFFSSRRRHTRSKRDWSSDVCSSDLDQAETVLMRLFTGSGLAGLRGIHAIRDDGIIRPLLGATRAEIEAFLRERGETPRADRMNADPRFFRTRIRRTLSEYEPWVVENLA